MKKNKYENSKKQEKKNVLENNIISRTSKSVHWFAVCVTHTSDNLVVPCGLNDLWSFLLTGAGFPRVDLDVFLLHTGMPVEFTVAGVHHPIGTTHRVGVIRAKGLVPAHTESNLTHSTGRTVKVQFTGYYKIILKW